MKKYLNHLSSLLKIIIILFVIAFGFAAFQKIWPQKNVNEMVAVSVVGYNHIQDKSIIYYSVNGGGGSPIPPFHGGGSFTCCVQIPLHWKPGLKAEVHWNYGGDPDGALPNSAIVDIPEYTPENMGKIQVHFYPNNRVRVISTRYLLGHSYNPLPKEDWAPWEIDDAWARNQKWQEEQEKQSKKDKNDGVWNYIFNIF